MIDNYERYVERLAFEQICSKMAKDFVKLDTVESSIQNALKDIGEYSNASRAYIFAFQDNGDYMDNTYEWCNKGVSKQIHKLQGIEIGLFPWWMEKLSTGDPLIIKEVSLLGDEAKAERDILEMQGIVSVLVMPIMKRGVLNGFVGFDSVRTSEIWHEEDTAVIKLASELFSSVFDRIAYESEIQLAKDSLEISLEALKQMHVKLVQQEQMVAIGQLAAGVAHEINNPLGFVISNFSVMRGYTTKLAEYANKWMETMECQQKSAADCKELEYLNEDLIDLFDEIDEGLLRVRQIVDSLRYFSRVDENHEYSTYDLKEGVVNTLTVISNRLSEDIELNLDLSRKTPPLIGYGGKINQVILNLAVNAIDAVHERFPRGGGKINIEVGEYPAKDEFVYFKIEDNGIGLSDTVKKQMFNPFFTTKPVGKGSGLGMSIVYDTVKNLHKGEIFVESVENEKTEITILLPKKFGDMV